MKDTFNSKSIFQYGREKISDFKLSIFLIFISTLVNIMTFYLGYKIINELISGNIDFKLLLYGLSIILLKALQGFFVNEGLYHSHIFAYHTLGEIRKNLLFKMAINPLGETLKYSAGYIRQKLVDSVEQLEIILAHMFPEGIPYVLSFFVTLTFIFIIDFRLGFLALIPFIINMIAVSWMQKTGKEHMGPYYEAVKNMSGNMTEYISGIEVIKIFNQKDHQYKKLKDSIDHYKNFTLKWYDISYTPMAIAFSLSSTFSLAVLPVGTWMLMKGYLEISKLIFVSLLCFSLSSSGVKLMAFMAGYMNLKKRLKDIEADFLVEPLKTGKGNLETIKTIEFREVHFAYGEDKIIKGVNLKINRGEEVAFVGESGSGKSTIIKLLMHYYDVKSGEILLNGQNIQDLEIDSLMDKIAYVSQDNYLFNITIRENLLIGNPNAKKEDIISACKAANIHDEILNLENGYDTVVGQSGSKLSGGEKQRICIARAILKDVDIVILDEATSNSDPENEYKINEAIGKLCKGRILISIAHKLSTIAKADKIFLLSEGRIIDEGKHEELLKNNLYKKLWDRFMGTKSFEFKVGDDRL